MNKLEHLERLEKIKNRRHVIETKSFKLNFMQCLLIIALISTFFNSFIIQQSKASVLMRACDTREIKTVTSRVCMLYKRTKNSDVKMDKQGHLRIARGVKGDYSPAKLASDCCKIGCPPHIFAYNC